MRSQAKPLQDFCWGLSEFCTALGLSISKLCYDERAVRGSSFSDGYEYANTGHPSGRALKIRHSKRSNFTEPLYNTDVMMFCL
jgi:hypothetical protein